MPHDPIQPAYTEDTPATPGWVETSLDDILATLPETLRAAPRFAAHRDAYLDGLAASRGPIDAGVARDRCRIRFLAALTEDGLPAEARRDLELRLEGLEADLGRGT